MRIAPPYKSTVRVAAMSRDGGGGEWKRMKERGKGSRRSPRLMRQLREATREGGSAVLRGWQMPRSWPLRCSKGKLEESGSRTTAHVRAVHERVHLGVITAGVPREEERWREMVGGCARRRNGFIVRPATSACAVTLLRFNTDAFGSVKTCSSVVQRGLPCLFVVPAHAHCFECRVALLCAVPTCAAERGKGREGKERGAYDLHNASAEALVLDHHHHHPLPCT